MIQSPSELLAPRSCTRVGRAAYRMELSSVISSSPALTTVRSSQRRFVLMVIPCGLTVRTVSIFITLPYERYSYETHVDSQCCRCIGSTKMIA